jgi:hypothetical protein
MNPRVEELLAERALRPLDDKEHWELQQLGGADDESFDMAAAAVVVATTVVEPMPQSLADRILAAAPGGAGGVDWRRTLPGVAMPPPPDQPRDTMVSLSSIDVLEADTVLQTDMEAAQRAGLRSATTPPSIMETLPPSAFHRTPAVPLPRVDNVDPSASTLPPDNAHVRFAPVLPPQPQAAQPEPRPARDTRQTPLPHEARQTPLPQGVTPAQTPATLPPPVATRTPSAGVRTSAPSQTPPLRGQTPSQQLAPFAQPHAPILPAVLPVGHVQTPPGHTPLPQDSAPFSVEQPPMSAPISRERERPSILPQHDELVRRRESAKTVPLKKPSRGVAPWLAAALCLLVAGGAVWWGLQQRGEKPPVVATKTIADDRAALVASATDLYKSAWTITPDAAGKGATGDVVWSAAQQKGYMRFVGLQVNDPSQFEYQLWIFDKTRDQAFPVDGGVFDVGSNGEVIVPISPKLHVNDLALFAVTVEKPGGVVVSKRERIVVTAART